LDDLSDEDFLRLHREVCRRAAALYEPMHREKRDANRRQGMAALPMRHVRQPG
jgi:hypothetical protein